MNEIRFENRLLAELPGDPESGPRQRQVTGALWSRVMPTAVAAPVVLARSREMLAALGLSPASAASDPEFARVFAGNALVPGMDPFATCYGGHQFGHWAGQLGDGRAISLGEAIGADGGRHELQLKGAGRTPYSRGADGRAVLRSSLREFVCSEAMHHLGIPTTRALCLVGSGETVVRDMFYDGRPRAEPGAIVCRVAPSFLRLGHFELPAARGDAPLLQQLIAFCIDRDFPELAGVTDAAEREAEWFGLICERTAILLAHWLRVGFVHGVMNTDNLSVLGLTIDYGPFGWIEHFDPLFTPNTTDAEGRRYSFGNQAAIARWNLGALAGALATVWPDHSALHAGIARFDAVFGREHASMTAAKFGYSELRDGDAPLVESAYALLQQSSIDVTLFFRRLAALDLAADDPQAELRGRYADAAYDPAALEEALPPLAEWTQRYAQRQREDVLQGDGRVRKMDAANPMFLPRNHLLQQAIERTESGDSSMIEALLEVLRRPYDEQPGAAAWGTRCPDAYRDRPGCSTLSCSS